MFTSLRAAAAAALQQQLAAEAALRLGRSGCAIAVGLAAGTLLTVAR